MKDPCPVVTRLIGYTLLMVIIAIVCWPLLVKAEVVAIGSAKGDRVVLTDEPCKSDAIQKVKPEYRGGFRHSTYYMSKTGQIVTGCWWKYEKDIITIWSDGDVFALPEAFFSGSKI